MEKQAPTVQHCKIHQITAQFQQCRNPRSHQPSAAPKKKSVHDDFQELGVFHPNSWSFTPIPALHRDISVPGLGSQQPAPIPMVCASTDGVAATQSSLEYGSKAVLGFPWITVNLWKLFPLSPAAISALAKGTKGKGEDLWGCTADFWSNMDLFSQQSMI